MQDSEDDDGDSEDEDEGAAARAAQLIELADRVLDGACDEADTMPVGGLGEGLASDAVASCSLL